MTTVCNHDVKNVTKIPIIGVSRENYDILSRIANDFDMSIKDVADQMIQQGVKCSSFRQYANPASAIAQKKADNIRRGKYRDDVE
jgi:myo-inositol catabolism protein IolC